MCYRNGIIVYKKQTGMDETVITCSTLNSTSTFHVIRTGDPIEARNDLQAFFDLLHKGIEIDRAEERMIYSEQFLRYHEKKETEVSKALELLYKLFGCGDITRRDKSSKKKEVYYLKRVLLNIGGSRIDIKSYRPKNYQSPAKGIKDHPKLEVTVYYEKTKLSKEELEKVGRNLIATVAEYANLYDYILPSSWGFNYPTSGQGNCILDVLRGLEEESLRWKIEQLQDIKKELFNSKTRAIALKVAEKARTAKEISEKLNLPVRTVQYHLKKLKKAGIISSYRRGNNYFYSVKLNC